MDLLKTLGRRLTLHGKFQGELMNALNSQSTVFLANAEIIMLPMNDLQACLTIGLADLQLGLYALKPAVSRLMK
jgi:hypothetical protein